MAEYKPMFDFLKADRQEGESDESVNMRTASNERALMAGATPLLVGLLTGNTGEGVEIASKGLMEEDKRLRGQQTSLMDYLRKQNVASQKAKSGTPKTKKYIDEKGDVRWGYESDIVGKRATGDSEESKIRVAGKKLDQRIGRGVEDKSFKTQEGFSAVRTPEGKVKMLESSLVSPRFKERASSRYNKTAQRIAPFEKTLKTTSEGIALIDSEGVMPKMAGITSAIKSVEGTRMTDEDRNFLIQLPSKAKRIMESSKREVGGKIPERLLREAKEMFSRLREIQIKSIKERVDSSIGAISRSDAEREYATQIFSDLLPSQSSEPSSLMTDKQRARLEELRKKRGKK